jgi:hypothetical protein
LRRVAAVVVVLLVAGCGSGGDDERATPAKSTGLAVAAGAGKPTTVPGNVLLEFVRAAGRGDARATWSLLSGPTQASIGPTFDDFRGYTARQFRTGVGSIAGNAKVIFSRSLADDWAVAAVAGDRTVDGEPEHYAFGAALLPENGRLKLELGGVVITGHKPAPLEELDDPRPKLAVNVGAGGDLTDVRMWLDGKPFPFERGPNDPPFTATMRGRPADPLAPGRHEVVVFAATSDTATAGAWTFTVT